jgi:hypothetical protein
LQLLHEGAVNCLQMVQKILLHRYLFISSRYLLFFGQGGIWVLSITLQIQWLIRSIAFRFPFCRIEKQVFILGFLGGLLRLAVDLEHYLANGDAQFLEFRFLVGDIIAFQAFQVEVGAGL